MRYSFPDYQSKRKYVQPDSRNWKLIKAGMTYSEVVGILGEPMDDPFRPKFKEVANAYFSFGWLDLPFVPRPRTYSFLVQFNAQGKVCYIQDPFAGAFSEDGIPSKPIILIPQEGQIFSHFPRIVDVRWHPPAGDYPMKFELQIGHGSPAGEFRDEVARAYDDLESVYFCDSFVGACPGRVRVRAKNHKGTGEWSDFRTFRFTV